MDAWPCMHGGWACWPATRGRAEPREDDVRRRLYGRRVGLDDDGDAGTVEMTRSLPGGGRRRRWRGRGRDDEIDVVDRKVEDEQRNRSIYIGRDPLVPAGKPNRD